MVSPCDVVCLLDLYNRFNGVMQALLRSLATVSGRIQRTVAHESGEPMKRNMFYNAKGKAMS
jgi:hypothetical protein